MPSSAPRPPKTKIEITDQDRVQANVLDLHVRTYLAKHYAKEKEILKWGKVCFPDKFYLPYCPPLHNYLIDIRLSELAATEAPRNHAKTQIECFLIEIFQALNEPELFDHYLNVQATQQKALDINTAIRHEIETNEVLRAVYGNQIGNEKWTDGQFVLANGRIFTAVSAGQSIRGINHNGKRPDCIRVDDLYDEEDIENPEKTEKKNRWFWGSLYPARAKSRRTSIHITGTAINNEDLLNKLKESKRWKSRSFDAILDEDAKTVLWPELNTYESLMDDKLDMGSIIFDREMRNIRRNDANSIIKMSHLHNWEYEPIDLRAELAKGTTRVLLGVAIGNDPSIGKKMTSDETGTALVLMTGWIDARGGNEFWIEYVKGKQRTMMERIEELTQLAGARAPGEEVTTVEIEAIAGFDDYASEVVRKTNLPVHRVEWTTDKITNLINKQKFFENGKIHLNRHIEQKEKDKLVHQLTTNFPKHDDLRDAVLLTLDDESGIWKFV